LNEHLPPERRYVEFTEHIIDGSTLGEAIKKLGVPLQEVELLVIGKESVGLTYVLEEGDRVSVYPVFDSFDVGPITQVQNRPLRRLRFVLDVHLGKLAHLLRMLGFDALYQNDYAREELVRVARDDDRILLSKGRKIIEQCDLPAAYQVKSSDPREQLIEILRRFDLRRSVRPFRLCLHCNGVLIPIQKERIIGRLPPRVRNLNRAFTICPACDRIYWKGAHVVRMAEFIDRVLAECGY
jgi:uncharacterized protein with PIN domain